METTCAYCNKKIDRPLCRISEHNYCNATCQNKFEYSTGTKNKSSITKNANKKTREIGLKKYLENPTIRISKRGYQIIYIPKASMEERVGWRYYHHYLWEKYFSKKIEKGFCVHHKDGNPLNNSIENLEYMKISEHDKLRKNIPTGKNHWAYKGKPDRKGTNFVCLVCKKEDTRRRDGQKVCSLSCASKLKWIK